MEEAKESALDRVVEPPRTAQAGTHAGGNGRRRPPGRGRRITRWSLIAAAALVVLTLVGTAAINFTMTRAATSRTVSVEDAARLAGEEPFDAILVLGAGITADGRPTPMLASRMDTAAALYHAGAAPVLLASGDNSRAEYNELAAMHRQAVSLSVPAGDVYLDYAGFSTYETMYRARDVFSAKRILVVTQSYHLPRALHDARALGLDAYGVAAASHSSGQRGRDLRETLARVKDFGYALIKPKPTFLGDKVDLTPGRAPALIETPDQS
ncbi:MAG: YdcF family protein [Bifidobacteriaceae bacterium]|jgi:vancomycin permeability regulator SanA|nr:YdcF family protein [Bifidobacteriaceae bacterium]